MELVIREGACRMLQAAIENEIDEYIERFKDARNMHRPHSTNPFPWWNLILLGLREYMLAKVLVMPFLNAALLKKTEQHLPFYGIHSMPRASRSA